LLDSAFIKIIPQRLICAQSPGSNGANSNLNPAGTIATGPMLYTPRGQQDLDFAPGTLSHRAFKRRRLAQIQRTGRHAPRIEAKGPRYAVKLVAISTTRKETLAAGAQGGLTDVRDGRARNPCGSKLPQAAALFMTWRLARPPWKALEAYPSASLYSLGSRCAMPLWQSMQVMRSFCALA
jgi:hypothetical protein